MATIGMIGGRGQMGALFRKVFEKHGHEVIVSGRTTELTSEELVRRSDIVIITVPIEVTIDVIKSIIPHTREAQLLMDFTSIKTIPVEEMKRSRSGVVGCHPMFGPGVDTLKGQTIIFCPIRENRWYNTIHQIFKEEGAKLKITTPEKHDEIMAVIQGMIHFSSITMCHALKELGIDIKESLGYTSPVYKLRMDMIGRILNQDPGLYADIELSNPTNNKTIGTYLKNQQKLLEIIKNNDRNAFISYFKEASDFLGDFTQQAENESNELIRQMIKNKENREKKH
jgi:prephenate dehydrogenase